MRHGQLAVVAVLAVLGCSRHPTTVGVTKIRVYPGARLVDHEVSHSRQGETIDTAVPYTLDVWKFESKASADEIFGFYQAQLPAAEREPDDDHALRWRIEGPKVWEVDIHVEGATFTIAEDVKD